jgi:hypothetical protein
MLGRLEGETQSTGVPLSSEEPMRPSHAAVLWPRRGSPLATDSQHGWAVEAPARARSSLPSCGSGRVTSSRGLASR